MRSRNYMDLECPKCFTQERIRIISTVPGCKNKELKKTFLRGELNVFYCKGCDSRYKIGAAVYYNDSENEFGIWYAEDKEFVPAIPKSLGYHSKAKVVHDWDTLLLEILLLENQIHLSEK